MNIVESDSWRVRRAAYVRPSDSTNGCKCTVRFLYATSGESAQASLHVQYATTFAGTDKTSHVIIFSISPKNTRSCHLALSSDDSLVPPLVLPFVPSTSVHASSDVLTLSLVLKTFGTVLHSPNIATFRPANSSDDADFEAFVNICQATVIHLHFARAQFGFVGAQKFSERRQLRDFVGDFNTNQTAPVDFDLVSADSGRGLQEGTWRVFESSCSTRQSPAAVLGKRRRLSLLVVADPVPLPPYDDDDDGSKTPPPYSPTEIITPSPDPTLTSQASSPNVDPYKIQPSVFKHMLSSPHTQEAPSPRVALLASILMLVTEDDLQAALVQSGHARLCASGQPEKPEKPKDKEPTVRRGHTSPNTKSQTPLETPSALHTAEHLRPLLADMFTTEIEARLQSVVELVLPRLTEQALARVVDPYYDQFYTECEAADMAIQEKVDENTEDLKSTTYDGVKELEQCGEKYVNKLRLRGGRYLEHMEEMMQDFSDTSDQQTDKFSRLVERLELLLQQPLRSTRMTDATVQRCSSV